MKKYYVNVYFSILEEDYDIAFGILSPYNILGIEEKFDELMVCFAKEEWTEELKNEVLSNLQSFKPYIKINKEEEIPEINWSEEVEKQTPAIIVSDRIGIAPEWKLNELNTDIKITINPKMSFGTGQHATTKLVAQLMEDIVTPGDFWIDAGTGTGVLAILAVKLGAKGVFAFDNDEWSINNTIENCEINGVSDCIKCEMHDIFKVELPKANGITANLFLNLVKASLPAFFESLKDSAGHLLVSGILEYDKDIVIENAINAGFELIKLATEDEWVAFYFRAANGK